MTKLNLMAATYEPPKTLNISELDKVSVDVDIVKKEGKNKKNEPFEYFVITVDNKEYRVPAQVLAGLKALLGKMPTLKYITVLRLGDGSKNGTSYQVLPYIEQEKVVVEQKELV